MPSSKARGGRKSSSSTATVNQPQQQDPALRRLAWRAVEWIIKWGLHVVCIVWLLMWLQMKMGTCRAAERGETHPWYYRTVHRCDKSGSTPVHVAAVHGHVATLRVLYDSGYDLKARTRKGMSPVMAAAFAGQGDAMEFLVSMGALEAREWPKLAVLGARAGRTHVLQAASNAGADHSLVGDMVDVDGVRAFRTPACAAAEKGHFNAVQLLANLGVSFAASAVDDPFDDDDEERRQLWCSPLWLAAANGHHEVVAELASAGLGWNVDAASADPVNGWTAARIAVEKNDLAVLNALARHAPRRAFDGVDVAGLAPAHRAAVLGRHRALWLMAKRGVDLEIRTTNGSRRRRRRRDFMLDLRRRNEGEAIGATPALLAARHGNLKCVAVLAAAGVDLDATDGEGIAPIFAAASEGHDETVAFLASLGVDRNRGLDLAGLAAVHVAAARGHASVVAALNASSNLPTLNGETPVQIAVAENHLSVLQAIFCSGSLAQEGLVDLATQHRRTKILRFLNDIESGTQRSCPPPVVYPAPDEVIRDALSSSTDDAPPLSSLNKYSGRIDAEEQDEYSDERMVLFLERDGLWRLMCLYQVATIVVLAVVSLRDVLRRGLRWATDVDAAPGGGETPPQRPAEEADVEVLPSSEPLPPPPGLRRRVKPGGGGQQQKASSSSGDKEKQLLQKKSEEVTSLQQQLRKEREDLGEKLAEATALLETARKDEAAATERSREFSERAQTAETRCAELTAKCRDLDNIRAALERDLNARPSVDLGLALTRLDVAQLQPSALAQIESALPRLQLAITREVLKREMDHVVSDNSSGGGPQDAASECIVCLAGPRSVAFNCGHLCVCSNCAYNVDACPICRNPVLERRRIFRS